MLHLAVGQHCLDHDDIRQVPQLSCSESHGHTLYGQLYMNSCEQLYIVLSAAMQ